MSKKLPVGEPENTAEQTVAEFKGQRGLKTRHDHAIIAAKVLDETRARMAEGYEYYAENGRQLETPEEVMQLALARRPYQVHKPEPPEEKPDADAHRREEETTKP